jgi:hypothetical protein
MQPQVMQPQVLLQPFIQKPTYCWCCCCCRRQNYNYCYLYFYTPTHTHPTLCPCPTVKPSRELPSLEILHQSP